MERLDALGDQISFVTDSKSGGWRFLGRSAKLTLEMRSHVDHFSTLSITAAGRHVRPLAWALSLAGVFLVVEVIGGLWTGSLALLADAGHMLSDVGGLALTLFAIWFARKPPTPEKTYGYYRVEVLAAFANAVILVAVSGFILFEAYRRFADPPEVMSGPMLVIALGGLGVNLVGLLLLRKGSAESLNLWAAYLEVLGDALGSLGVILAALIMLTTGWRLADPLVSTAIALFILTRTWSLLRRVVNVLLEGTPPHVDLREVAAAMTDVPGVQRVHDLHVWTLTSGKEAMSGHVVVDDLSAADKVIRALHDVLHGRFGIEHTTIQPESEPLIQIAPAGHHRRDAG